MWPGMVPCGDHISLAILDSDSPVIENTGQSIAGERVYRHDGFLYVDSESVVTELVTRNSGANQKTTGSHARLNPRCHLPTLETTCEIRCLS
jgi:hypothetical protein